MIAALFCGGVKTFAILGLLNPPEGLALQLHFVLSSESMGNHDSGYDEWRYVC
ncbi:hypothetical protein [Acetobacter pomorum]|uniref:hypothetical protein n=1 Tax=Acetobacter pomorum TaxID=65959 RepID=UPI0013757494|nr:hypothetical protein [Acetobacter pomorum]